MGFRTTLNRLSRRQKALLSLVVPVLATGVLALVLLLHDRGEPVGFNADVRPLFNERCIACHGGVKQTSGFSVLFRSDALDTTESGRPAILPGDPGGSELLRRVTHPDPDERMPPEGPPLTDEEVETLARWIEQGAKWETHWAYVKPEPKALPDVQHTGWPQNEIDFFVLARLEEEGLQPSPRAGCARLLRRVSLDLTGLPPTPEEAEAFCADPSPAAYGGAVDRLLASPRFGEHWAAMWLDLARYADTKGYERDAERTIWRYRDWLIRAFNRDLPFDRFTTEQIAGDLLPGATDAQILATAFHRNTMTNDEGGTDDEEFRLAAVLDRVNTTWEVWQGTTFACVQCHSHPYDPFRHEEYYQSVAFFNNTEDADRYDERPLLVSYTEAQEEEVQEILTWMADVGAAPDSFSTRSLSERVDRVLYPNPKLVPSHFDGREAVNVESEFAVPQAGGAWIRFDSLDLAGKRAVSYGYYGWRDGLTLDVHLDAPDGPRIGRARLGKTDGEGVARVPLRETDGTRDVYFVFNRGGEGGGVRLHWIYLHDDRAGLGPAVREQVVQQEQALVTLSGEGRTPVLRELPPERSRTTRVFERGNWLTQGEAVQPDVPASLGSMPEGAPANRLGFAEWLTSPENPLTARVAVNRFWARLFGIGIVETEEDFGTQGLSPSHPDLLDGLAFRFMHEHNWSVKALLKEIVTSATYQQTSAFTPELLERDPQNRLLARGPRFRLSAEEVRDQALAVSGLLSDKMYGPSVMPPQPPGIWNSPYNGATWETEHGEDRYRRGLYTFWKRTSPYPSMVAFDSPTREFCVARRVRTNTPLQALVTLNDPVYVETAQALAGRMATEAGPDVEAKLRRGCRLALIRDPEPERLRILRALYDDALAHYHNDPDAGAALVHPVADTTAVPLVSAEEVSANAEQAALTVVANAILNLDAFVMKE